MVNLATSVGNELRHRQAPHRPHFGTQIYDRHPLHLSEEFTVTVALPHLSEINHSASFMSRRPIPLRCRSERTNK
jgi:hypothetical protein